MENQVLTAEQMQELTELGIDTSKASMYISEYGELISNVKICELEVNWIPTFTLQDILEMLPESITTDCGVFKQVKFSLRLHYGLLEYSTPTLGLHTEIISKKETSPLLQAAFNMLKWCSENNHI